MIEVSASFGRLLGGQFGIRFLHRATPCRLWRGNELAEYTSRSSNRGGSPTNASVGGLTMLDRVLQSWRVRKALAHIPAGSAVCDIGTYDGALFAIAGDHISDRSVGIDPDLMPLRTDRSGIRFIKGLFPDALGESERFQAITALAVLEHIPKQLLSSLATAVHDRLEPNGVFVVTCPHPNVDRVLDVLTALHLVHGQSIHQHYGLHPQTVVDIFGRTMKVERNERFQLGFNRLVVFRRVD